MSTVHTYRSQCARKESSLRTTAGAATVMRISIKDKIVIRYAYFAARFARDMVESNVETVCKEDPSGAVSVPLAVLVLTCW